MVKLRLATLNDFDFFYGLKCEESNIDWTGHGEKPKREDLYRFFKKAVENADAPEARKIFIVENEDAPVGHLYLIPNPEDNSFELAPAVLEKHRGKGYAKMIIEQGLKLGEAYHFDRMYTSIREDNIPSLKAFTSCGVTVLRDYKMVYIPKLGKEVKMYFVEKKLR